jgi:hypothetical protein
MAMRRAVPEPAPEPPRISSILAELNGSGDERAFREDAERIAAELRPSMVSRDWAGVATVAALDATRLLEAWKRDRSERQREQAERVAQETQGMVLPFGCVQVELPGRPVWTSPGMVGNPAFEGEAANGRVSGPG